MLSLLMSVYGGERADYLDKSLRSVWVEQSRQPDEIVLVKDGHLPEELERILDSWRERCGDRFKIVPLEKNLGLGPALRAGLSVCRGEFVARMDSDDIALSHRFEQQLNFLEKFPEVDILGSAALLMNKDGDNTGVMTMPCSHERIKKFIWSCPIIHPSVVFKREAIMCAGSYSASLPRRQEDYELWIRCARYRLIFHNIKDPLISYRIYPSEIRKNNINVGWHRMLIGWPAVAEFDPRLISFLGVTYPFLRALTPRILRNGLMNFTKRRDPRSLN